MNVNPSSSSGILSQILGERETVAGLKQAGLEKQAFLCLERKEGTKAAAWNEPQNGEREVAIPSSKLFLFKNQQRFVWGPRGPPGEPENSLWAPPPPDLVAWGIRSSPFLGRATGKASRTQERVPKPRTANTTSNSSFSLLDSFCILTDQQPWRNGAGFDRQTDRQTELLAPRATLPVPRAGHSQASSAELILHNTPPSCWNPHLTLHTVASAYGYPRYFIISRYTFKQRKVYQELKTNKETTPSTTSTAFLGHNTKVPGKNPTA